MANKYLALKKDVFDINKVTVVGSPTITSDGVVTDTSGYSGNCPYIEIPALGDNWEMVVPFNWVNPTNRTTETFFRSVRPSYKCFSLGATGTQIYLWMQDINQTDYNIGFTGITNFTNLLIKITCQKATDGYLISVLSSNDDGKTWTTNKTQTVTVAPYICQNALTYQSFIPTQVNANVTMDLTKFSYSNGAISFSPTKPTYLLERRKPKVWNKGQFTIVGSPTISESGVASGLDNTANILFPIKNEDLVGKSWTISGACLPVAGMDSRKVFAFGNNAEPSFGSIAYVAQYNRVDFQFKTGDTTSSSAIVYIRIVLDETPSKIYFNLSFDRNSKTYTLKVKSDNSSQWQEGSYIATTDNPDIYNLSYYPTQSLAIRAWANSTSTYTWSAPVDLKCYSVEIEGNLVFDGGAETYVYDPSKFTIVGSPTITEYGVASGFGDGKYINTTTLTPNTEPWSIIVPIITGSSTTGSNQTFLCKNVTAGVEAKLDVNGKFVCYLSSDGSNPDIAYGLTSSYVALPNTKYYFRLSYDGAKYEMAYSFDNVNFTVIASKESDLTIKNGLNILLGDNAIGASYPFQGSIDLPQFLITVDGKEVFTGAKENYYMLRR